MEQSRKGRLKETRASARGTQPALSALLQGPLGRLRAESSAVFNTLAKYWQKSLKEGRVYLDSRSEGVGCHHGSRSMRQQVTLWPRQEAEGDEGWALLTFSLSVNSRS